MSGENLAKRLLFSHTHSIGSFKANDADDDDACRNGYGDLRKISVTLSYLNQN
jgi:hypothetical protein